jgi:hypothetical protein
MKETDPYCHFERSEKSCTCGKKISRPRLTVRRAGLTLLEMTFLALEASYFLEATSYLASIPNHLDSMGKIP